MAKLEQTIEFQIQNLPKVKTLIELLDKYRDGLPIELKESLNELADSDQFEYDTLAVHELALSAGGDIDDIQCLIDGELSEKVSGVNTILKRVNLETNQVAPSGDCFVVNQIYPKHFIIKTGDKVLIEFEQ